MLPNDMGTELTRDFPDLMEARYQMFGRGGPRAAPAIPRRAAIADASALARAQAERSRQREATAKAEERTEKVSKQLAESKLALFNSQEETDAANERLAGLKDELRRARQQSAQNEQLEREAELRRRSDEARRREAEARRREADENRSAAERERDRLRADLEELKAKEDARDADAARTRANAHVLLGEDDDDDVATLGDRVQAFRSAIATMRKALGEKDALSIWDEIYQEKHVGRDTLVENVMEMFGPATATKEWTADQMFMRPIRVEFDRCGAVQRSGKSSEKGKEAGVDDGGLRNEMYEKFFEQLLLLRPDLFEASESAGELCARALPTKDATWTALPDAARIEKDFETVGRVMCRAVVDGRPIPNALASTIVLRFFQGVEPAALDASGAMVRGPLSKAALLEELLLMDEDNASSIGKWILNSEQSLTDIFSTVGDALCYNSTEDRVAASDAQILAMPWNDEPAFRILVFERLVQRRLIEPRRKALEAMRRGFATVEMVPQLTRTLFPSSKELVHFICGDDKLDADKLWSLFTFDPEAYSQTAIDYEHYSGELYTEDDPTMRHLKVVLSEFCDAERLKFFKFVSGLAAIPVTRPGEAKPFQLLVDGKDLETNRLPTTSTCYYQLHCPPYPTKDVLKDKLRLAIEAEGFDQK